MVMNVLEEHSGSVYTGHHDGSSRSRPNRLCRPFTLHGPITEKTTILNLNIIHFSRIVSLCYKKLNIHMSVNTQCCYFTLCFGLSGNVSQEI